MNDNQPPNRTNSANDAKPSQHGEGNCTTPHLRRHRLRRIHTLVFVISIAFILALATSWYLRKQRQEAERLDQAMTRHEKRTLEGHQTIVESIAISPDGKTLVSASLDGEIKQWDLASGQPLATFNGHESDIFSLAISPDGKTLASAGADKMVKLWEMASHQNLSVLKGHEGSVTSIVISPDGNTLASASYDATIKLWEVASGRNISTFTGHNGIVDGVAFSPDGKRLASAGADETVKLWEVASGQNLATLEDHGAIKLLSQVTGANHVRSVAFSPDGGILASAHRYNRAKLWDVASYQTHCFK